MTFEYLLDEREREGKEIGKEIGKDRVNQLHAKLLEADRIDDLKRSTTDPAFQKKLFEEFAL